jgi:hypothetical protein
MKKTILLITFLMTSLIYASQRVVLIEESSADN